MNLLALTFILLVTAGAGLCCSHHNRGQFKQEVERKLGEIQNAVGQMKGHLGVAQEKLKFIEINNTAMNVAFHELKTQIDVVTKILDEVNENQPRMNETERMLELIGEHTLNQDMLLAVIMVLVMLNLFAWSYIGTKLHSDSRWKLSAKVGHIDGKSKME